VNSVATLIIPSRKAAEKPRVAEIIAQAEVIFIASGDLSGYVNFWKGTPVEAAINAHVAANKPIGGTSAGLAVLGQFVYGCLEDKPNDADLTSREVLADPYTKRLTVVRDFLKISALENILTDSHFAKRDRMGRSLGFLARIVQHGWSKTPREIAIDEKSALLVEASGVGKVVGTGLGVYFLRVTDAPEICKPCLSRAHRSHAPDSRKNLQRYFLALCEGAAQGGLGSLSHRKLRYQCGMQEKYWRINSE